MPLPAETQAALDRSLAALGGQQSPPASDLTPVIQPGWSVMTRAERAPVVYDHTPAHVDDDTGEQVALVFHCAALPTGNGSRGRGLERMDVAATDVTSSLPPDARYIGDVLACGYRELGRGTASRDAARGARRAWVSGVVAVLEGVRRSMGWG
jgi:hypothetical protein